MKTWYLHDSSAEGLIYKWGGERDLLWDMRGSWEGLVFRPEITLLCVYQKFISLDYKLEMQVIQ